LLLTGIHTFLGAAVYEYAQTYSQPQPSLTAMIPRMNAVVIESDDSYECHWEDYEPDWEDLAYQLYKDREFEQWVSWIRESNDECRASVRPDRQLRNMNKERGTLARELWQDYQFDVESDSFGVSEDSETYVTVPRNGASRSLSRKDKRRMKGNLRKHLRKEFGILTKRGIARAKVRGYEDMNSAKVVAAM
jgi:hypothetical protein